MTSSNRNIFRVTGPFCGEGNTPVSGEFPSQRPVTRSFDVFFDLCLNKWLSKQSWRRWFETPSCSLWRHCNAVSLGLWAFTFGSDVCPSGRQVTSGHLPLALMYALRDGKLLPIYCDKGRFSIYSSTTLIGFALWPCNLSWITYK